MPTVLRAFAALREIAVNHSADNQRSVGILIGPHKKVRPALSMTLANFDEVAGSIAQLRKQRWRSGDWKPGQDFIFRHRAGRRCQGKIPQDSNGKPYCGWFSPRWQWPFIGECRTPIRDPTPPVTLNVFSTIIYRLEPTRQNRSARHSLCPGYPPLSATPSVRGSKIGRVFRGSLWFTPRILIGRPRHTLLAISALCKATIGLSSVTRWTSFRIGAREPPFTVNQLQLYRNALPMARLQLCVIIGIRGNIVAVQNYRGSCGQRS